MKKIEQKAPKEVKVIKEMEKQEDYYKGFRSAVVLAWMFCNFLLAATVLSTAGLDRVNLKSNETQRSTIYMAVVLWSVAALSLFRFCGAVWFLVVRLVSSTFSLHEPISAQPSFSAGSLTCMVCNYSFVVFEKIWMIPIGDIIGVQSYDQSDVDVILHGVGYGYLPAGASSPSLFYFDIPFRSPFPYPWFCSERKSF